MGIGTSSSEDWPAIEAILTRLDLPCADITPQYLDNFLVLRQDAQVVGVVGLEFHGPSALLRSLAVVEPLREQGLGTRLVREAERVAISRGIESIHLLTTSAEAFFAKLGYVRLHRDLVPDEVKATAEFKELCPDTAVCMRKRIPAG